MPDLFGIDMHRLNKLRDSNLHLWIMKFYNSEEIGHTYKTSDFAIIFRLEVQSSD